MWNVFWNVMTVLTTLMQLVSTYPPQKKTMKELKLEKKIALYENIKFYDYIP